MQLREIQVECYAGSRADETPRRLCREGVWTEVAEVVDRWHQVESLPDEKGTYILLLHVPELKRLQIGRLGTFDFRPGFYGYVGSACGAGGLRARIGHHLEAVASPHWHVDYLMRFATLLEVWYAVSDRKLEQDWVELLENENRFRCPVARFGSSDYRRSRRSHLFFTKRRPSFSWFQERIRAVFEPEVRAHRATVECNPAPEPPGPTPRSHPARGVGGHAEEAYRHGNLS